MARRRVVDRATAREAVAVLSTAIAQILEDADPALIVDLRGDGFETRARALEAIGGDIATLAAAIGVLAKRSHADIA